MSHRKRLWTKERRCIKKEARWTSIGLSVGNSGRRKCFLSQCGLNKCTYFLAGWGSPVKEMRITSFLMIMCATYVSARMSALILITRGHSGLRKTGCAGQQIEQSGKTRTRTELGRTFVQISGPPSWLHPRRPRQDSGTTKHTSCGASTWVWRWLWDVVMATELQSCHGWFFSKKLSMKTKENHGNWIWFFFYF